MMTETHDHTTRCWWDLHQARWVCPSPTDLTADRSAPMNLVDVRDMIVVHTALLRELRLAPAAVRRTAHDDAPRVRAVADHLRYVCALLHHHHEGEDRLLWPLVRARTSAAGRRIIDTVDAQHADIDVALATVEECRVAWAAERGTGRRDRLDAALTSLHEVVAEHLDLEERALLPLAAGALTEAEWRAVGEEAVASSPKSELVLTFGMFAYEGDPEVLRDMLRDAPPPVRFLLPRIAPRVYARRARLVHGTARP